jgi:hypothetical protein
MAASTNIERAAFGEYAFSGPQYLIDADALPPTTSVISNPEVIQSVQDMAKMNPSYSYRAETYVANQPVEQEVLVRGPAPPDAITPLEDARVTLTGEVEVPPSFGALASVAGVGALNVVGGGLMLATVNKTDPQPIQALQAASGTTGVIGGAYMIGGAAIASEELMCVGGAVSGVGMVLGTPVMIYQNAKMEAQRQNQIAPLVEEQLDAGNTLGAALLSVNPLMFRYGF